MRDKRVKVSNTVNLNPVSLAEKKYAASLQVSLPEDATMSDARALIDRELDDDNPATKDFINYARAKGMKCSDYIGNKALHTQLFDNLSLEDKVVLFCFCVYKFLNPGQNENLLEHVHRKEFEAFGKRFSKDGYFIASLEDYLGEDCVYFGKSMQVINGNKKNVYGGSIYGRAYKEAVKFLNESL